VVSGKKLVGSAQRRLAGGVLQHGSILLGESQRRFPDFIKGMDEGKRAQLEAFLSRQTISISESLGRNVPFEEAAAALKKGFESSRQVTLLSGTLSETEKEHAKAIRSQFAVLREGELKDSGSALNMSCYDGNLSNR
jgi:lipoate-protein ligase A